MVACLSDLYQSQEIPCTSISRTPAEGSKIRVTADFSLGVPDNPIIPYIEGDGIGVDISPVMIESSRCGGK